jgi:cation diffusion facilitator CzcD-associated flavoprotein CzcO
MTSANAKPNAGRPLRFIVMGAGLSGIMSAIKLEQAGFADVTLFEKADRPGGTWRDNTYPGIACDIPSHFYSYSFAPNPEWSSRYAPGSEIQSYIESVMRRYDVARRIRFGEEIIRCEFSAGRWQVETKCGHRDVADVLIAATGVTHHPNLPDIPGLESMGEAAFHSARWNHQIKTAGAKVGIVGTGSSSVQIVPALVNRAAKVSLFQRTPQWIMPQENVLYTEAEKANFRSDPRAIEGLRSMLQRRFTELIANALVDIDSPQYKAIEDACIANLETQVTDPALKEKLRPNYRAACKRLVVSPDFYAAIQSPNAELVVERIDRIEANGVRTRDGRLHELDVLVLATGFKTHHFMRPIEVIGPNGLRLNDVWSSRPRAYLTVAVPGFPNLFMLNGPHSPVGNFPLIEVAELQMNYVLQLIAELRNGCRGLSPSPEITARYDQERIAASKKTIWATGCNSWYIDGEGVPAAWPWKIERFYEAMSKPDLTDYVRVD